MPPWPGAEALMEEMAVVLRSQQPATALKPLLEECGYTGSRIAAPYAVGERTFPLVGFAGKPWDRRSACIAVVNGDGDPGAAAALCRELGAPIVWVAHDGLVDWWTQHDKHPSRYDSKPIGEFRRLVRDRQTDLCPDEVYRLKTLGRLPDARQLDFVDAELMPLLEAQAGEKLGELVENMTRDVLRELRLSNPGKTKIREVFTVVFRLLAGKILHDKKVRGFAKLALDNPKEVLQKVSQHYRAAAPAPVLDERWVQALAAACEHLTGFGNVRAVSPETLAYVYEHTLVSKPLRKKLGIHATPQYLVDYMLWQLYDWIRDIPSADRHVFEPACGHSPFLLAAMRMLRLEMEGEADRTVHTYLKKHIHGVEIGDFAREIARLSLTLADIPSPDGWDLQGGDMYASNVLPEQAQRCRILLSNPPYEKFDAAGKRKYAAAGHPVRYPKALELLDRTLKHLVPGAVFGVVVPQGLLHNTQARDLRRLLLAEFEIREICLFADKLFDEGDAETAVLLGRRRTGRKATSGHIKYRRVRENAIRQFADRYAVDSERMVAVTSLAQAPEVCLRLPDLPEVWDYLANDEQLDAVARVGQGFSFEHAGLIEKARTAGHRRTKNAVPAFLDGVGKLGIWTAPRELWLDPTRTPVKPWRSGKYSGEPQVLVNYSPVMRGPWRIKALLDPNGHAVTNTYMTVRPNGNNVSITFLWALLNSPMANAYVYCNALKRHIYDTLIASLPLPPNWRSCVTPIVDAAKSYLLLVQEPADFSLDAPDESAVKEALLQLDAAVMRAYRLPVRLERAVLNLFRLPPANRKRHRRKGVGCTFDDYFPADFDSLVPLHKYVSASYRQSTVADVAERMKPGDADSVLGGLRTAADAFGGD